MTTAVQAETMASARPSAHRGRRRLPAAWWLLALLPPDVRVVVDVLAGTVAPARWALAFAPVLALLAVITWAHASQRPLAVQLKKELNLLGPLAMALLPAGGALQQVPGAFGPGTGLILLGGGAFFVAGRSFAAEVEAGTFVRWVLQPHARTRLIVWKYAALALLLFPLTLSATVVAQRVEPLWITWIIVGLALPMGPYFGVLSRSPKVTVWVLLGATLSIAAAGLLADELFVPALFAWGLVCVVATFRLVRTMELGGATPFNTPLAVPRFWRLRAGRTTPRLALLQKELRLQVGPAMMGLAMVLSWFVWELVTTTRVVNPVDWAPPEAAIALLWCLGAGAAVLSGAMSFAEERVLGTMLWQEALVPRAQLYWAKLGASLLTTLAVAVVLPLVLLSIAPGWGEAARALGGVTTVVSEHLVRGLMLANFMLALWAVGLLASTVQRDTTRATVLAVAILAGVLVVIGVAFNTAFELLALVRPLDTATFCKPLAGEASRWTTTGSQALVLSPLAFTALGAVWVSRQWWRRARVAVRPAVIALVVLFAVTNVVIGVAMSRFVWCGR